MKKIQITIMTVIMFALVFSMPVLAKSNNKQIVPEFLEPGDTIAITSPAASRVSETKAVIDRLKNNGYNVLIGETNGTKYGYFAGTDAQRAAELNDFFANPDVDAILCMRGGYGCSRILDLIDYDLIKKNPKLLIGFSDITALHAAIQKETGITTIHGPVISTLAKATDYTWNEFLAGIKGDLKAGPVNLPNGYALKTITPGTATGRLVGGNLTVLMSLMGTKYEPDFEDAILFVEDVGEAGYRIDRMMYQLYQSGSLDKVKGIVFGEFVDCEAAIDTESIMQYYGALVNKPCIKGMSIGHGVNNAFIPIGAQATIQANEDGSAVFAINY